LPGRKSHFEHPCPGQRGEDSFTVEQAHIAAFMDDAPAGIHWQAAALARLSRVPEGFMRDTSRQGIEDYARQNSLVEISLDTAEAGLAQSRESMQEMMQAQSATPASDSEKKT